MLIMILRGCKLSTNNTIIVGHSKGLKGKDYRCLTNYVGLLHTVSMYKYQQPVSLKNFMIWVNSKSFFCTSYHVSAT